MKVPRGDCWVTWKAWWNRRKRRGRDSSDNSFFFETNNPHMQKNARIRMRGKRGEDHSKKTERMVFGCDLP